MEQWALLVPERGIPLNFKRFPFQREWYSEAVADAREVVWMKSAQVGMSTYAWRWAARRAEQFSDNVIYFFPTDDDVADFSDQRIEPSIVDSPLLNAAMADGDVHKKHLKRIGGGWLGLRGTMSKRSVQSVDADALVFDEYDYCHQGNIGQAERRIAGAVAAGRRPRIRRLGYPTMAGQGIHAVYEQSDKRVWHVTCGSCGAEQPIRWGANLRWRSYEDGPVCMWGHDEYAKIGDVHEVWRVCGECEESLEAAPEAESGPIHEGRWIATAESELVGYHVSRLIVPVTDLAEIVRNSRKTSPEAQESFWNNDLGEPFSPSEAALTDADVDAAIEHRFPQLSRPRPRRTYLAGLDCASVRNLTLWIAELGRDGLQTVHQSEPASFEDAEELLVRFGVSLTVVDHLPEGRYARGLAANLPGRVVLGSYDARNESDAFKLDPKKNMVRINRTEAIDAFQDSIRQTWLKLPAKLGARVKAQLLAPKRRTVVNAAGKAHREYVSTGTEGDDYTHAGVFLLVAVELWNLRVGVQQTLADQQPKPVGRRKRQRFGFSDDYRAGFGE